MKASKPLTNNLQAVLVDLIELQLQSKQAHWSVVGTNFRDLHRQLDEVVASTRAFADEVAERMRALNAEPDGRSRTVAQTTNLGDFPLGEVATHDAIDLIAVRLETTSGTIRTVHDQVDEEDPTTADILHTIIEKLEQYAWMISAENRSPGSLKQTRPGAEKSTHKKKAPSTKKR